MEKHKTIIYLKVYWRSFAKNWSLLGIRNVFSRRRKQLSVQMFVDPCIIARFIKKIQQDATIHQNFIIPYLSEAQHVLGDTPPIIRSLKLHWQPLVFHTWKVVGRVVGGRCPALRSNSSTIEAGSSNGMTNTRCCRYSCMRS